MVEGLRGSLVITVTRYPHMDMVSVARQNRLPGLVSPAV